MPKGTRDSVSRPPTGPERKEQKKRKAEDRMYERNKDKLEAARRKAKSDPKLRKALAEEDAAWKAYSKSPKGLDERGDMELYREYQKAARKRVQIAQSSATSFSKGGMVKKKGYNKGGMANCGASVPGTQKRGS